MATVTSDFDILIQEAAIRRLVTFYCDAVSRHDHQDAASVFAPDGRLNAMGGEDIVGSDAVAEILRQTFSGFSFLQQICHTGLIDISGDCARARWSICEFTRPRDQDALSIFYGSYEDELVKLETGWRFAKRSLRATGRTLLDTQKFKTFPLNAVQFAFSL